MTSDMAHWLENEIGMETRVTILGHIQRGGSPTVNDRMLGFEFVVRAVDHLLSSENSNKIVVIQRDEYKMLEIEDVVKHQYTLDPELLGMLNRLD